MPTIINGDGVVTAGGTASTQGKVVLAEQTGSGTNTVTLQAPATLASDLTFTMPTADGTNGQYLRTNGSGALSFATVPTTSPAGSTGQLQINNAGAFGALSEGTSGQVLTSNGAGVAPSFATPASGSLILVQTVTSSTDTIDITGSFSSTYRIYKLYLTCQFTNSNQVLFYFYLNGSLITNATHGYSGYYGTTGAPTLVGASGLNGTYAGSLTGKLNVFEFTFFNPSNSTNRAPIGVVASAAFDEGPRFFNGQFFNQTAGTAGTRALTGIRATTGGDTGTWTAKLYGIKE